MNELFQLWSEQRIIEQNYYSLCSRKNFNKLQNYRSTFGEHFTWLSWSIPYTCCCKVKSIWSVLLWGKTVAGLNVLLNFIFLDVLYQDIFELFYHPNYLLSFNLISSLNVVSIPLNFVQVFDLTKCWIEQNVPSLSHHL